MEICKGRISEAKVELINSSGEYWQQMNFLERLLLNDPELIHPEINVLLAGGSEHHQQQQTVRGIKYHPDNFKTLFKSLNNLDADFASLVKNCFSEFY